MTDSIQAAIQKAREARERLGPSGAVPVAVRVGQAQSKLAQAAAWTALPELHPDPLLLERNLVVSFGGGGPAVTFDVMRTKVLQTMRANKWRRLAITSPGAASGKTTTCLNLAFSLGRQPDLRSIVIEADLRRPAMARILGLKTPHQFATVLQGHGPAGGHLLRHGPNLAFGTTETAVPNPAELLHSALIGDVLAGIEAEYAPDLMIFDMPPMQVSDDAIGFMGHVDCVLLIAAAGSTTVAEVDRCEQELAAQTNVMGVVLNKCRYLDMPQGYDADYHA